MLVSGTADVSIQDHTVAVLGAGDDYGDGYHHDRFGVASMSLQEFATVLAEFPDVGDSIRRAARDRAASTAR